ncbi:MAG: helix-turn-helix domain-containing protein [Ruminiclostridium sp.]
MLLEKAISIVLKSNRLKCGLSQEELAFRCELDRTYISLLEREKRRPTLHVVFKICDNLNIRPTAFIQEIEKLLAEE